MIEFRSFKEEHNDFKKLCHVGTRSPSNDSFVIVSDAPNCKKKSLCTSQDLSHMLPNLNLLKIHGR